MQYDLGIALNYGLVKESVKNEVFPLFQQTTNKMNSNTLNTARSNKSSGGNFGVLDPTTGMLTIPNSFGDTLKEIESVTTRDDIVNKLTAGAIKSPDKSALIADDKRFTEGKWFVANPKKDTKKPNWDEMVKNSDDLFSTTLSDGTRLDGVPFGSNDGIRVLFKVPKKDKND